MVVPKKAPELFAVDGGRERAVTDEELISAIERGDTSLGAKLYDHLCPAVDHTLLRVFGRREVDHEDLVQTAFEQIILTLSTRSFARACSLKTWASSITAHVGLNALRARRRERRVVDRACDASTSVSPWRLDPERESVARGELMQIRAGLSEMKPAQSEVVFLHDVLGHDLSEIAVMLGVSVAAAQSRLVRGRSDLLRRLERTTSGRSKSRKGAGSECR